MAKGQRRSNRETKKPKKTAAERAKTATPAPVLSGQRVPPKGAPKKR
jgi:hypothetical protein